MKKISAVLKYFLMKAFYNNYVDVIAAYINKEWESFTFKFYYCGKFEN